MAEGFYLADDNPDIPIELRSVVGAVFTLFTNRQLHYQLCAFEAEADAWSGLQQGPVVPREY